MERDDSHKKVGYRVSYGSGDDHDTVVARTMVPHLENIYGNKGEIFLLESPYYEKRESEAFKEYFSLKKEFSRDKGFTVELSNKEALNLFSDRKILSVEHYGAGINPVQCSGGSIFSLEGGIFLKGYSGSGQGGINEAVEKNNLLVGKTVGGAF